MFSDSSRPCGLQWVDKRGKLLKSRVLSWRNSNFFSWCLQVNSPHCRFVFRHQQPTKRLLADEIMKSHDHACSNLDQGQLKKFVKCRVRRPRRNGRCQTIGFIATTRIRVNTEKSRSFSSWPHALQGYTAVLPETTLPDAVLCCRLRWWLSLWKSCWNLSRDSPPPNVNRFSLNGLNQCA